MGKNLKVLNFKGELVKEIETSLPEARKITGKDLDSLLACPLNVAISHEERKEKKLLRVAGCELRGKD